MNPQKSVFAFSLFLFFLSLLRLWDKDLFGFSIFLVFSSLFFYSYFVEQDRLKKLKESQRRKEVYFSLSIPKITLKNEGNSQIITLVVPSQELFNEMKTNDRNV